MPDLTLMDKSAHPIREASEGLRSAWRAGDYTRVRMMLLTLVSILRNPDDARRCLLVLAAIARARDDQRTEAHAFWLLAATEQQIGNLAQASGDYTQALRLLEGLELHEHVLRCRQDLAGVSVQQETMALAC